MDSLKSKRLCVSKLKVLADETRLHVIRELMAGEHSVTQLNAALDIDQSLLSHHLSVLRTAGLVISRREGKAVHYRLAPDVGMDPDSKAINLGCCQINFVSAPRKMRP